VIWIEEVLDCLVAFKPLLEEVDFRLIVNCLLELLILMVLVFDLLDEVLDLLNTLFLPGVEFIFIFSSLFPVLYLDLPHYSFVIELLG